ncbi:MAG: HlyD family efflux transporter periplasmic adaptor subunit, partial [Desulfovibrio sp.]|nr:HlyD family efflux transporter periplasmic adaptor subunit [Desulfovibrio sp.]
WPRGIESSYAVLDGSVSVVTAEVSGPLAQLLVHEGDEVHAGDEIARLDMTSYSREVRDAEREISSLRGPDMETIATRLKEAQAAEQDAIARLATVRHEEEAKERQMEALVMQHVQAQLAMRSLGDVTSEAYRAALRKVEKARKNMEEAKEAYEASSRIRAEVTRELARIRQEVQEARAKGEGRTKKPASAPRLEEKTGIVRAPCDGTVLRISAKEGETIVAGDPLLLLLPKGSNATFWVKAWFLQDQRSRIKEGALCRIEKEDGTVLAGRVEKIGGNEPHPRADEKGAFFTLTVTIKDGEGKPGENVRCRIENSLL